MTIKEIHAEFVDCGKRALEWRRKCELLLPLVAREKVWARKGFSSIYEYAAKLAGMSRAVVDAALWTARKIEDKPALQEVAREKGLSRVRPVANLATQEDQEFWAEKAKTMSKHTLEAYAREYRNSCPGSKVQPEQLDDNLHLPPALARRLQQLQKRQDFNTLLEQFIDQVESQKPEPVHTQSRSIPAPIRRHTKEKTGYRCAYPGCHKPGEILHHTQRFALEKVHDPDRLVYLCHGHEGLAHHNLIENEESHPSTWTLRTQPDRNSPAFWIDQLVALYRPG